MKAKRNDFKQKTCSPDRRRKTKPIIFFSNITPKNIVILSKQTLSALFKGLVEALKIWFFVSPDYFNKESLFEV